MKRPHATKLRHTSREVPQPRHLLTRPDPQAVVLASIPLLRKVPFVQWLSLLGWSLDSEGYPCQYPPFDGGYGVLDQSGYLAVQATANGCWPVEDCAAVYWDFQFSGKEPIDIQVTAATHLGILSHTDALPSDKGTGGGFARYTLFLRAQDTDTGELADTIVFTEASGYPGLA